MLGSSAMSGERHFTVLMADLAGYTALTEAHGSAQAAQIVARYLELAHEATVPGARLMERVGDGLVFVAAEAAPAVETALRLRALVGCTARFPRQRAGLHSGAVVVDGERYVGHALNVAARVTEHAKPGQVLCTEAVALEAGAVEAVTYRRLGPVRFKNLVQPVTVYEVVGGGIRDTDAVDPVCRMQVDPTLEFTVVLDDRRYVFCSLGCRDAFVSHPENYTAR
jgi:class 3 adenylate cyclase